MKALIVYVSISHANTKRIAKRMAEVLDAELLEPEEIDVNTISDYDLIGFGSGIYWGRFYKRLRNFIRQLPVYENKKAFTFATCGERAPLNWLEKQLAKKGFDVIGSYSCLGYCTFILSRLLRRTNRGKPNEEEFQKAEEFATSLKDYFKESQ